MACPISATRAAISAWPTRIRPGRGSSAVIGLAEGDVGWQSALGTEARGDAGRVVTRLEGAHADLVARLAVLGAPLDHVGVDARRAELLAQLVRLPPLLEHAHLHRPLRGGRAHRRPDL